ncbi:hypothetical protein SDC9_134259 [bioreactor metagenome]|uniref:Uncharacterized protein n=1 Tax=bioreactor metagenome TaxID=1076179 RepID=A0A645DD87_9ZZZZ
MDISPGGGLPGHEKGPGSLGHLCKDVQYLEQEVLLGGLFHKIQRGLVKGVEQEGPAGELRDVPLPLFP